MAEPVAGNASNGSADNGAPRPGNAEDSLKAAFGSAGKAGAAEVKPEVKPATGDAAAGGTGSGGGIKMAPWAEQLPAELRDNPDRAAKLAKFQKLGDMAKAYLELTERPAGDSIPGADAPPEAAAAFWEKAGKPKTAEGYTFAADTARQGDTFARAAFAANLTAAQADAMFKGLEEIGAKRAQAAREAREQEVKETAAALQKEYGSRYAEKMELLTRGLAAAGPNVAAMLAQAGLGGKAEIVKAFITFGQITAESGGARGGGTGTPLQSVFEGATFDDYK
jgi:hypothetical protein